MAKGGRAEFSIDYKQFESQLNVVLSRVETGTKKATSAACQEILEMSLSEVPRETNTLANSAFFEIHGKYRNFTAVVGYGGHGDPVNPVTGERASSYMVAVHERLDVYHPTGKAKFLEDPVRAYQTKYAGRAANIIRNEVGM